MSWSIDQHEISTHPANPAAMIVTFWNRAVGEDTCIEVQATPSGKHEVTGFLRGQQVFADTAYGDEEVLISRRTAEAAIRVTLATENSIGFRLAEQD